MIGPTSQRTVDAKAHHFEGSSPSDLLQENIEIVKERPELGPL